jgi:hypothetical protein
VYLRISYEFDGAWNEGYENAARYVHAWRRIVNTLREHDTNNVQFVWQAGAAVVDEVIDSKHEDIADWYPGDGYVDWMAFSWFMNPDETIGIPESAYDPPTPKELAGEVLRFARQHEKPVMIAEASPQAIDLARNFSADHSPISDGPASGRRVAMSDAGIWDHWYGPLFDLLNDHENIRALAYINANWDAQAMWGPPYSSGFWGDSRLETNEHIAKRFSDAIHEWRDEQQAAE